MNQETMNLKMAQNAVNKLNDATVRIIQLEAEVEVLKEQLEAMNQEANKEVIEAEIVE